MPDPCTTSIAHLLQLHQSLLKSAGDELLTAFESISDAVGRVIESTSDSDEESHLIDAIVKLQAADSVAQRLQHVESGLGLLEQKLSAIAVASPLPVDDALIAETASLFTMADERATFATVFADEHTPAIDAVIADDPDLFLFDDSQQPG